VTSEIEGVCLFERKARDVFVNGFVFVVVTEFTGPSTWLCRDSCLEIAVDGVTGRPARVRLCNAAKRPRLAASRCSARFAARVNAASLN
jgi:hypothetical protein